MKMISKILIPVLALALISFSCSETKTKPVVKGISSSQDDNIESAENKESKIHWVSFEEVQVLMKESPKKIIVDVYTDWCGPCKLMMKNTFTNPKIIEYINENYYAVKWNAECADTIRFNGKTYTNPGYNPNRKGRNSTHDLTKAIAAVNGRLAYPTTLYIDEEWNFITGIQGYLEPKKIEPILHFIHTKEYAKGTDYATYLSTFQSTL